MYNILVHIHSGLRWLVLLLILWAILEALVKCNSEAGRKKLFSLMAMVLTHMQLIIGFILYFISPKVVFDASSMKNTVQRFFLVEHMALMLIAIILVTIGYVKSKKAAEESKKRRYILIYYIIALVLMLASIPWPFRGLGAGWF